MQQGFVLWLTGLSGSGKSTIASLVEAELRERSVQVERLDGDEVRENLSKGLGFSKQDRDTHVRRVGWVCSLLARNGIGAITALISPYAVIRDEVRGMTDNFVEVFVDAPLEEVKRRDVKGLYRRALAGEIAQFTGVSDPYEAPTAPELHLRTDGESPDASAATVVAYLEDRGWVPKL